VTLGDEPNTPPPDLTDPSAGSSLLLERLALLVLAGAVGSVLAGFLGGLTTARFDEGAGTTVHWNVFLYQWTAVGGGVVPALLVAVALALALGRSSEEPGRLARDIVAAVSVVGVVVAALSVVGIQQMISQHAGVIGADQEVSGITPLRYGTAVATFLPAGALAFGSAYLAWRWLQQHDGQG